MKKALLSAAAAAALSLAAFSAQASEDHLCLTDDCVVQSLFNFADAPAQGGAPVSLESPHYGTWGFDLTGRDLTARPGDDFYKYASGAWDARTEIPSDRTRFGNFDALSILSEARVNAIIADTAAGKVQDKDAAKIGDAYKSFMDEATIEKLDLKPLAPELAAVKAVKTHRDMTALGGKGQTGNYASILGIGITTDAKSPQKYAVAVGGGGLGLPDRDYYLDAKFADKKAAYEVYITKMLTMAGWENPAQAAKDIIAFETKIAEGSWTRAERRNRDLTYNPMTRAELVAYTPGFDWDAYLAQTELPKGVDRFILTTNTAFPKFAKAYAETPIETLKAWQAFKLIDGAAPMLSKRFVDANFEFRSKTLGGQPEQRPRWKRGVAFTNNMVGESVGRIYVARYFPPESKAKMISLVGDIRSALKTRIEGLPWMSPETKVKALDKLAKFTVKIGYPEEWRDYSALTIKADDLYGNATRAGAYEWRRDVSRLFEPVDKKEWGMTPQTVNAYYNSVNNEIVFPAAILQAPFFDPTADDAINYGGIGGVIGHEISHGFDDQGRKSNGDGVLTDWWTAEDAAKFKAQADKLGAQYSAFEPLPGAKVQGALTMGENIGDLGGLSLAYDAYLVSLKGRPAPVLDGITGQQRVFYGWAQVWRAKIRDEALRQQVVTDPHSPAYYRVNGTIRNVDAWYDAFGIKEGDKLYVKPEDRVRIW
ncbi:M13-type metalloendopeptidase [Caulobacter sp. NIBR1757]|uniref:M13 family metallopeptidase n=1 Tax=Caulobacter sp. NIBR1757 TaxID=3016000 RepID=UPI0022F13DE0|nr:M13-type metalloendopeptidase [Caulobacter sp. NIBR1757]WGM37822.1 Neutral endopeptidase [Caulobacter sp. NIBR1757]